MIVPSLPALFTDSSWKVFCYICPLLRTFFLDKPQDKSIFFDTPWPFHKLRVEDFLPPMKTLYVSASLKTLSNLFPVSASVLLYSNGKLLVFLSRPVSFVGSILVFGGTSLIQIWIFPLSSYNLLLLRHCKVITIAWGCLVQEIGVLGKSLPQVFKFVGLILILILVDYRVCVLIVIFCFRLSQIVFAAGKLIVNIRISLDSSDVTHYRIFLLSDTIKGVSLPNLVVPGVQTESSAPCLMLIHWYMLILFIRQFLFNIFDK